jgi:hypothetical protein
MRHDLPVSALRGHGVISVSYGNDALLNRNVLSLQVTWVPAAIVPLVVTADGRSTILRVVSFHRVASLYPGIKPPFYWFGAREA